jgi:hypothetical protein
MKLMPGKPNSSPAPPARSCPVGASGSALIAGCSLCHVEMVRGPFCCHSRPSLCPLPPHVIPRGLGGNVALSPKNHMLQFPFDGQRKACMPFFFFTPFLRLPLCLLAIPGLTAGKFYLFPPVCYARVRCRCPPGGTVTWQRLPGGLAGGRCAPEGRGEGRWHRSLVVITPAN